MYNSPSGVFGTSTHFDTFDMYNAMSKPEQKKFLQSLKRLALIDILQANDQNGIWSDADAITEFGQRNTKAILIENFLEIANRN